MITKTEKTAETTKGFKKPMDSIREAVRGKNDRRAQEEKDSVLEIISDLEKQLEAAFAIKDAQEKEIEKLKSELEMSDKRNSLGELRNKEIQGLLVSQEKMNFNLEFLENERLQATEQIKALEANINNNSIEKEGFLKRIEQLIREGKAREARIDQME
ncbi:MAG: hypothetical protein WCH62_09275, partial [Candidatus Omnitrophota bacterium]